MSPLHIASAFLLALVASLGWAAPTGDQVDQVLAGRALFRGEVAFAKAPTLQGVPLPGAACSQCHGLRGAARSEAGIGVPPIQWQSLMQGRDTLSAYNSADHVVRAIARGVGRQGQPLRAPMPQFPLTENEQRALLAYLQVLATDADPVPGVTVKRVVVASVLPLGGRQAATGERIRAAMAARFEAINAAGGVFGRRIELRVIDGGDSAASASLAARTVLLNAGQDIFALVGSLLPDPDADLRQLLKTRDVPMVATLGVAQAEPDLPQLTHLLPSLAVQLRHLAAEMSRRCAPASGTALLLYPPGAPMQAVLHAALPDWQLRPAADLAQWDVAGGTAAPGQVIALLGREDVEQLRERLDASPTFRCLGTLAVISGRPPSGGAVHYAEAVALPMPPVAQDSAQSAGAALWPLLGDTAARVFAEALARSGRGLDSDQFARALDTLHRFEPVPGLSVTFGPQQRHGFDVTYLWRENTHEPPHTTP